MDCRLTRLFVHTPPIFFVYSVFYGKFAECLTTSSQFRAFLTDLFLNFQAHLSLHQQNDDDDERLFKDPFIKPFPSCRMNFQPQKSIRCRAKNNSELIENRNIEKKVDI